MGKYDQIIDFLSVPIENHSIINDIICLKILGFTTEGINGGEQ